MQKSDIEKVILIVLDGFGLAAKSAGNPVTDENMPYLNSLIREYKSGSLVASGLVVGLEWGTYGNSEVGHGAMGTGRVVVQALARVNAEIRNKKFFKNEAFVKVLEHVKKNKENNSKVHLIGCVSPGGIHSHEGHLIGLLDFFKKEKFSNVCVHMITDGEDSGPEEAIKSLKRINESLDGAGAKIATIGGRNFAMDRVKNWPLIKTAWDAMVHGKGEKYESAESYIKESYKKGVEDAAIVPAHLEDENVKIEDGDGIIFFNFRNDRMRQLVAPFVFEKFKDFERGKVLKNLAVATMTNYHDSFPVLVAYPPDKLENTLGEVISKKGLTQMRIAEGEKEAHVTNFFNGGKIGPYPKEDRLIVPSRTLMGNDYLKHPEMSAPKITEHVLKYIHEPYPLMVVNFANSDMIAHTGNIPAVEKALGIVDKSIEKIVKATDLSKTTIIITADHGNSEEMIDPATHKPDTQHSTSNVLVVFVSDVFKEASDKALGHLYRENPMGSLIDIAPTVLNILNLPVPKEMTGSKII